MKKIIVIGIYSILGICLLLIGITIISNFAYHQRIEVGGLLSSDEKLQVGAVTNLVNTMGGEAWLETEKPLILDNSDHIFLVGLLRSSPTFILSGQHPPSIRQPTPTKLF